MAFKDFDNVDNETIEYENDEERLKDDDMEIGEGSPHVDCSGFSTCLPCQMSVQFFRSPFSLVKQQSAATNRLLEFDGNTKTSRTQPNSISNVFIEKLSEVKSRCVSNGLHGIVPNCGGDC